jgi:hypothetical protein
VAQLPSEERIYTMLKHCISRTATRQQLTLSSLLLHNLAILHTCSGRLAMCAIIGFIGQTAIFGQNIIEQSTGKPGLF